MTKKYFAIAVLVIVAAGLVVYLWNNSQNDNIIPDVLSSKTQATNTTFDISNWLTYRGLQYGYEVKYPKLSEISTDSTSNTDRGVGIFLAKTLLIPTDLVKEREQIQGKGADIGVSFSINNLTTQYTSPCIWYYAERENLNVESYDPDICNPSKSYINANDYGTGYFRTFAGEPAYVRVQNTTGTNGGLYSVKSYNIVFFHNGHPWEVQYATIPDHPSDKWKSHPYYKYLEQSVPVSEAIVNSFHFISATSTSGTN